MSMITRADSRPRRSSSDWAAAGSRRPGQAQAEAPEPRDRVLALDLQLQGLAASGFRQEPLALGPCHWPGSRGSRPPSGRCPCPRRRESRPRRTVRVSRTSMGGLRDMLACSSVAASPWPGRAAGGSGRRPRWSSEAGRPMWKSAPRGPAISSRNTVPSDLPVIRRITSPTR